jgi:hypothetical protein
LGVGGSLFALLKEFGLFILALIHVLILVLILVVLKVRVFLVALRMVRVGKPLGLLPLILYGIHHSLLIELFKHSLNGFLQTALLSEHLLYIVGNCHAGVRDQEDARQEAKIVDLMDHEHLSVFFER